MDAWQFLWWGGPNRRNSRTRWPPSRSRSCSSQPRVQDHPLPVVDSPRAGRDECGRHEGIPSLRRGGEANDLWAAATGPAFMEARLQRPTCVSRSAIRDAHPGIHGAYLNACSLFAILTGESPVGLPATLKLPGRDEDLAMAPDDAKYLQELAWKVYRREIKNTKPAK